MKAFTGAVLVRIPCSWQPLIIFIESTRKSSLGTPAITQRGVSTRNIRDAADTRDNSTVRRGKVHLWQNLMIPNKFLMLVGSNERKIMYSTISEISHGNFYIKWLFISWNIRRIFTEKALKILWVKTVIMENGNSNNEVLTKKNKGITECISNFSCVILIIVKWSI